MKKMGSLFLLLLALLLGLTAALLKRPSAPIVIVAPSGGGDEITDDSRQERKAPVIRQGADSAPEGLPDLHGLSVGTGEVLVEVPLPGVDPESIGEDLSVLSEEPCLTWPETSGKLKKIEDQVKDIREQIDEVTLDSVSRTLNSLPFVSAEPEEAEWHISGGKIELEIKIPAEDIKIGTKKHHNN